MRRYSCEGREGLKKQGAKGPGGGRTGNKMEMEMALAHRGSGFVARGRHSMKKIRSPRQLEVIQIRGRGLRS